MVTKDLNNAQLQLLDEIIGKAKIASNDQQTACLLGGVLSFIRTHANYLSDNKVFHVQVAISQVVMIEATSEQQAINQVKQQYDAGNISLCNQLASFNVLEGL